MRRAVPGSSAALPVGVAAAGWWCVVAGLALVYVYMAVALPASLSVRRPVLVPCLTALPRALRDAAAAAMQRSAATRPHLPANGGSGGLDAVDDGMSDVAKLPVLVLGQLGEDVEGFGG